MFNIVIFGPPGSGKGTQSERIIEKYQLKHLSTGDLLRAEENSGSALGEQIKALIDKGNLVPDEMVEQMVRTFVIKNKDTNGIIFDGFPRTVKQAESLQAMLAEINAGVNLLLSLEVADAELKKRLLARGSKSGRADDQNELIIENRITVYHSQTMPVIDFYKQLGTFAGVDGVGELDEIFKRICSTIESIY
jgi:adenylate kinase